MPVSRGSEIESRAGMLRMRSSHALGAEKCGDADGIAGSEDRQRLKFYFSISTETG
jgi:hypothetical protein